MFSESDLALMASKGIQENTLKDQISFFQKGFPYLELIRAAEVNSGIIRLSEPLITEHINHFRDHLQDTKLVKFVPASGAASRMFKDFFGLMQHPDNHQQYDKAKQALSRIEDFAFHKRLKEKMAHDGVDLQHCVSQGDYKIVLQYILTEKGLNYGFLPKGLLEFHRYGDSCRTPMEEHLVEAAHYGRDASGLARVHFTVSPQHRSYFDALEKAVKSRYEKEFGVKYQVSYSEQKPSTDTLAVDLDNQPFRQKDGTLLFRPGGHGALLENLNEISGDLIFIKNIDNVVPDHLKEQTYRFKKALAGLLLKVRGEIFHMLTDLEKDPSATNKAKTAAYLKEKLNVLPADVAQEEDMGYLRKKLDRPLRICGMVINEGEPGGGPFWVRTADGTTSLQIVETSQVDPANSSQQDIVRKSTHFNPVDLVCSTRDHRGNKFNLLKYRDPNTGFISRKSQGGRELKALELPGLWNGAMADWNTLFVEVPAVTFNPVKTVNDLLRKEHQPQG